MAWQSLFSPDTYLDASAALSRARRDTFPTLAQTLAWWAPVHLLTYSVVPLRHRLVWVNLASIGGGAILSRACYDNGSGS